MAAIEIIDKENELILRTPPNQIAGLGEATMLTQFSQMYGKMPVFVFVDRFTASAANDGVVLLYEAPDGGPEVCVGFMLLGWLTPAMAKLYATRNRELCAAEISGGDQLWVLDMSTPFGHYTNMKRMLDEAFPEASDIWGLRDGKPSKFSNSVSQAKQAKQAKELAQAT